MECTETRFRKPHSIQATPHVAPLAAIVGSQESMCMGMHAQNTVKVEVWGKILGGTATVQCDDRGAHLRPCFVVHKLIYQLQQQGPNSLRRDELVAGLHHCGEYGHHVPLARLEVPHHEGVEVVELQFMHAYRPADHL